MKKLERLFAKAAKAANTAPQTQKSPATESGVQYAMGDGTVSQNWMHDSVDEKYSYETLISKPDMVIAEIDNEIPSNRIDIVREAKKKAAKIGKVDMRDGSVSVRVDDIESDVVLATKGLRHSLDRRLDVNAAVTLHVGEILHNSIRVNELSPRDNNVAESYVLIGTAKNTKGDFYIVRSVVNRFNSELVSMDVLYAINAKKESAATRSPRLAAKPLSVTDSTVSIADLLELVNRYYPDVLPSNVLQHFDHDERPNGKIGGSALYSLPGRDLSSEVKPPKVPKDRKLTKSEYLEKVLSDPAIVEATKAEIRAANPLYEVVSDNERFELAQDILRDDDRLAVITAKLQNGEAITAEEVTALIMIQNVSAEGEEQADAAFIVATAGRLTGRALRLYNRHLRPYAEMEVSERYKAINRLVSRRPRRQLALPVSATVGDRTPCLHLRRSGSSLHNHNKVKQTTQKVSVLLAKDYLNRAGIGVKKTKSSVTLIFKNRFPICSVGIDVISVNDFVKSASEIPAF